MLDTLDAEAWLQESGIASCRGIILWWIKLSLKSELREK